MTLFTSYLLGHSHWQLSHHAIRKPKQSMETPHGDNMRFLVLSSQLAPLPRHVSESLQKWIPQHLAKYPSRCHKEQSKAFSVELHPNSRFKVAVVLGTQFWVIGCIATVTRTETNLEALMTVQINSMKNNWKSDHEKGVSARSQCYFEDTMGQWQPKIKIKIWPLSYFSD